MKVQSIKLLNTNNNNLTSSNKQSNKQSITIKSAYSDMNLNSNPNTVYAKSSIVFGSKLTNELADMIHKTLTKQEVKNIPETFQPLLSELQHFIENIRHKDLDFHMLPHDIVDFANEIEASCKANGIDKTIHQVKLFQKWAGCEPKDVPNDLKPLFEEFGNLIRKIDPNHEDLDFMKDFIPTLLKYCDTDDGRKSAIFTVQMLEKWAGTEALHVAKENKPTYNLLGKCFEMFGCTRKDLQWLSKENDDLLHALPSGD